MERSSQARPISYCEIRTPEVAMQDFGACCNVLRQSIIFIHFSGCDICDLGGFNPHLKLEPDQSGLKRKKDAGARGDDQSRAAARPCSCLEAALGEREAAESAARRGEKQRQDQCLKRDMNRIEWR